MIHINLIQEAGRSRKSKGQWDVRFEVALAGIVIAVALAGCLLYASAMSGQIRALEEDKAQKIKQVAQLQIKVKEVKDFEKRKKDLERKGKIIDQLEKRRGGPVRVMDLMSRSLEPFKLWFQRLTVDAKTITVQGLALSNDDVVGFINNLRQGDLFDRVTLDEIRAKNQNKIKLFQFKLKLTPKKE